MIAPWYWITCAASLCANLAAFSNVSPCNTLAKKPAAKASPAAVVSIMSSVTIFLGGILRSAEGLSAFFNPSINSYRRIDAPAPTSGASWSPSKISYTGNNRTHMIRIPDPGRFELRLMDGSANPYLLQAGIIAAGIDGVEKKRDPGQPLLINMYTDGNNYPNLKKLPSDLEQALEYLSNNEVLLSAFGEKNITSYLKLKQQELKDFNSKETFSKKEPISDWEKINTLDC